MKKALMLLLFSASQAAATCTVPPPIAGVVLEDQVCAPWSVIEKKTVCGHVVAVPPTYASSWDGPGPTERLTVAFPHVGVVTAPEYLSGYSEGTDYEPGPAPGLSCSARIEIFAIQRECSCLWLGGGDRWIESATEVSSVADVTGFCNYPACLMGGVPEPQ